MARKIQEVMTADPLLIQKDATLREAAMAMAGQDIGDVLVMDGETLYGILTDRDLIVRAVAESKDLDTTTAGDIASTDLHTVKGGDDTDQAVKVAREFHVRRVPVVEDNRPIGIVSLGDLALEKDPESALADISRAAPNN